MNRKYLLLLLVFISCSTHAIAQSDYYCYDFDGKKIPLTLNENKLVVSVPKDYDEISKRIHANVQALFWTHDNNFEFFFMTRSDLEKLASLDFWEEDAKSVIITPSYIKDYDRGGEFYREVFTLPYVLISLKKEEDIDLLNPYLEKYRLKIAWHSRWTPLAVNLSLPLNSEKGRLLEIANEMYESGEFASSKPAFAYPGYGTNDTNTVRSITTPTTEKSSKIYDLQGRHIQGEPQKGLYIQNGKKIMK